MKFPWSLQSHQFQFLQLVCTKSRVCDLSDSFFSPAAAVPKARRVLPEHEGRYKISMPSGTTAKSRAIIAKMQSDKQEKKSIFDRLTSDVEITSTSPDVGVKRKSTKSIFNRLGNYKELEMETKPKKVWPTVSVDRNFPDFSLNIFLISSRRKEL